MPIPVDFVMPPQSGEVVLSPGEERMHQAFYNLSLSATFQRKVSAVQRRYGLPLVGVDDTGKEFNKDYKKWRKKLGDRKTRQMERDVFTLAHTYGFYVDFGKLDPFLDFVLFDERHDLVFTPCGWDTVSLHDRSGDSIRSLSGKHHKDLFPIALYLSPYVTGNDIRDFLKKRFKKDVAPILNRYKEPLSKISKVRLRDPGKVRRDNMIHSLDHMDRKALKKVLDSIDTETPDIGALGKIRSKERQRRR